MGLEVEVGDDVEVVFVVLQCLEEVGMFGG